MKRMTFVAAGLVLVACSQMTPFTGELPEFDPSKLYSPPQEQKPEQIEAILKKEEITIDDYLAVVDWLNPELNALRQQVGIVAAQAWDAGLYPNPRVGFAIEDYKSNGRFDQSKRVATFSHDIVYSGRLGASRRALEKLRDVEVERIRQARRDILAAAKQAFVRYLFHARHVEQRRRIRDIAKQFHELVDTKFKNRAAPEVDVLKAAVELAIREADFRAEEQELTAAIKAVHAFMGNVDLKVERFAGSLVTELAEVSLDALKGEALAMHPRIVAAQLLREQAKLEIEALSTSVWPDVGVVVGLGKDENDETIIEGGFEIPIPLYDRNQAKLVAARLRERQSSLELEAAKNAVVLELTQAFVFMKSAQERALSYRETILPKGQKALEQARTGFQAGEFSLLDVLDAQRTLNEAELTYLSALLDLNIAASQVERVTGTRLSVVK